MFKIKMTSNNKKIKDREIDIPSCVTLTDPIQKLLTDHHKLTAGDTMSVELEYFADPEMIYQKYFDVDDKSTYHLPRRPEPA